MLLAAGLLAGLAALTRYVGVALIVSSTSVLLLAYARRKASWMQRLLPAVLFGAVGILPISAVLVRNLAVSGTLTGDRSNESTGLSFPEAAQELLALFAHSEFRVATILVLSAVLAAIGFRTRILWRALTAARTIPFAAFAVVHSLAILATQTWTSEPPSPRFFLPAYVALLFVFSEALDAALRQSKRPEAATSLAHRFALIAVVLLCMIPLRSMWNDNYQEARKGWEHDSLMSDFPDLRDSPMVDYLGQNVLDCEQDCDRVITNSLWAAFWILGLQPLELLVSGDEDYCLDWLSQYQYSRPRYVVWFANVGPHDTGEYCDIPSLASSSPKLELRQEFSDGAVYWFDPSA